MELEKQVTSLELSKKLKELGVKQESLFYWENCDDNMTISCAEHHDSIEGEWGNCHQLLEQECYSAFTVTELKDFLPEGMPSYKKKKDGYTCTGGYYLPKMGKRQIASTEPDACAKMLISVIESKLA